MATVSFLYFTLFSSYSIEFILALGDRNGNPCPNPKKAVHYRTYFDYLYPCYIRCEVDYKHCQQRKQVMYCDLDGRNCICKAKSKYCSNGDILVCDEGDQHCKCQAPRKMCKSSSGHKLSYRGEKCFCNYAGIPSQFLIR